MNINLKITRQENANYFNCKIGDTIQVDFEKYIAAVTASEIGNSVIDACKAQAVAARSFAMSRNVQYGQLISDASSDAQACRMSKYNEEKYPNALAAAKATEGEVLFYNFQPITAIYGASNGGRTISSQERWGSARPYLIEQDDPWDLAAGGSLRGPGVGLSQTGCNWAAKHGKTYKEILSFYYPNTILGTNYQCEDEVKKAMSNVQKPTQTIKKGSVGEQVVWVQVMLNALGYDCGTPDGVFGTKCVTATKKFQKKNGLTEDGIVGAKTANVLWDQYSKIEPQPTPEDKWIKELRPQLIELQRLITEILEKNKEE